jgi:pyruvate dehydrogenase E2 component (dihydrolipoamide acetyltransferase)
VNGLEVRLADVGEGLDEGEVLRWLVEVGQSVRRDEPLAEVQTDKAVVEVPAPADGTVTALHVEAGAIVPVGTLLATLRPTGVPAMVVPQVVALPPPAADTGVPPVGAPRPKASPALRRRAAERGVDLAAVHGTGPGGRITDDDLDAWRPGRDVSEAGTPPANPRRPMPTAAADERSAEATFRGIRRATAAAMGRSWSTIPHLGASDEFDATGLLAARASLADAAGEPITLTALLAVAVARTLRRHPAGNATVHDDGRGATFHDEINLGVACATPDGLVVPVLHGADRLGVLDAARTLRRITETARAGRLGPADLAGGTATLSNYGPLGGRFAAPVIPPGQTLVVGVGAVAARPWVVDGLLAVRPVLPWSISADHRLLDGADVLAFAADLTAALRDPVRLLL